MNSISLDEMQHVTLMDRLDTKFVAAASRLPELIERMRPHFRVQEINGERISAYSTQYMDTEELSMFVMHQNGKLNRQKIRIRSYVDSDMSFLEVKNKSNKGRTAKLRVPSFASHVESIHEFDDELDFLSDLSEFEVDSLLPSLANEFNRMTFVDNNATERITIDIDLMFKNEHTGNEILMENLMIIELKQDGNNHSIFKDILREMRIKKMKISKYCLGTVLTNPDCKYNRYKRKSRLITKIINTDTK